MLTSSYDRRLVMELSSASVTPAPASQHLSRASFDKSVVSAIPLTADPAHRRRSSSSIISPFLSQGLFVATATGQKRAPLAPLDPQFTSSQILVTEFEMSPEDAYAAGRKSSITLTNATRPTPYAQRNLPRRPQTSQYRRTSLPALHSQDVPSHTQAESAASPAAAAAGEDVDIYSRLSTFTFGDAQTSKLQSATPSSPSSSRLDDENISPLHRFGSFDKTPRPSVAHIHHVPKNTHGWSSPSSDEDERRRTNTRSKMRAIDDGTRRPSLPINDLQQLQLHSVDGTQSSPEKGKGKATSIDKSVSHQRGVRSSPSSRTGGEDGLELDTDVDMISAEDTDRRKERYRRAGGNTDSRISSDAGSLFGDSGSDFDPQKRYGHAPVDEDEPASAVTTTSTNYTGDRKDSARTWTQEHMGRRGSLPMDIPTTNSHSATRDDGYYDDYSGPFDNHELQRRARAHAQLRRPSRSVDDDLARLGLYLQRRASSIAAHADDAGNGGMLASSEPDIRGYAMAQAMVQAAAAAAVEQGLDAAQVSSALGAGPNDSPYQGLDLNYILSVSGSNGGSFSDGGKRRMSVGSSIAARDVRERQPSWAEGWSIASGRRQSTATVNDDTFLRFVKKHDYSYDERKREWTFAREPHERAGRELRPGQEIWRCIWVGRYKVDRVQRDNADPNKPPTVRLNIKHIDDPHTKSGTRGGPLTFIHKHSRAQAFSIFRGHHLPERHLKTSSSILLATKKVQEQFTQTHSTSKLSTHGLLEDKASTSSVGRSTQSTAVGSGTNSATASTASVNSSHRTPTSSVTSLSKASSDQHSQVSGSGRPRLSIEADVMGKGKGVTRSPFDTPTPVSTLATLVNNRTPTGERSGSDANTPTSRTGPGNSPSQERSMKVDAENARPVSMVPSMGDTASFTSEGSQQFSSAISAFDQSSISTGISSTRGISSMRGERRAQDLRKEIMRLPPNPARGSVGSLEEQPVVRTSHAEAFATLNPLSIEYLRMHSSQYDGSSDHDSGGASRRFGGLRKLFHTTTQPAKASSPSTAGSGPGAGAAVLEGHFQPPWLTMAARSKQEEQERVIKNLNDSFRDVGLLPSFKPSRSRHGGQQPHKKGKRAGAGVGENVIDQIPDHSLYMLLPMWPGETDTVSVARGDGEEEVFDLPLHERQYLLVYYVANELSKEKEKEREREKEKEGKMDDKKRSRSQLSSNGSHTDASFSRGNHHAHGTASISSSSRSAVKANTVSLSSFNILARLVSYKDVNGSGIRVPSAGLSVTGPFADAVRAIPKIRFEADDLALIIAFCASRARGVEVVPEGAEKLGLCLPREREGEVDLDPDADAPLSPLGRAALEMAWLGALAVMGFASVT